MTAPPDAAAPPDPEPRTRRAGRRTWGLAVLPLLPWAIGLLGRWWWLAELFTHFRFQWLLCTGAAALVLLALRAWRPLAVCGLVALLHAWPMLGGLGHPPAAPEDAAGARGVRVMTANVLIRNTDAAAVLRHVREADPDVICFQEVGPRWLADLSPLHEAYPHRAVTDRDDPFGAAVFSKHPGAFEVVNIETLPQIRATLDTPAGPLTVWNVHVSPPAGARRAGDRDRAMAELARRVAAEPGPVVVAGDLNCTAWSPHFAALLAVGGLSDPRRGGRDPASWRAENPLFALPIDHVLPGGGARVTAMTRGPDVGSDHRPLTAAVVLPAAAGATPKGPR